MPTKASCKQETFDHLLDFLQSFPKEPSLADKNELSRYDDDVQKIRYALYIIKIFIKINSGRATRSDSNLNLASTQTYPLNYAHKKAIKLRQKQEIWPAPVN